jgi:hypothetical protein
MKLQQGQRWKCADAVVRIVRLERMSVDYKATPLPTEATEADEDLPPEGTHHHATKKEFCRLIKGAELLPPA